MEDAGLSVYTVIYAFSAALALLAIVTGVVLAAHSKGNSIGHLLVGISVFPFLGLVMATVTSYNENESAIAFARYKESLTPAYQMAFDKSCSTTGFLDDGHVKNCYETDGYRVWSVGDRYYVGVVNGNRVDISVIFERDKMIMGRRNAVVFADPDFDLQRFAYSYGR